MKNVVSEYKLLGYYLLKIYERTNIDNLRYEQVKALTDSTFKRLADSSRYALLPIEPKRQIIDAMIKKNVFRTNTLNGKTTFSQVYNYEAAKFISAVYACDHSLTFKLPKNISSNDSILESMKSMYTTGLSLQMQASLNTEINLFIQKTLSKNRGYA